MEIAAPLNDEGIEIAYFDEECGWEYSILEADTASSELRGLRIEFINGLVICIFCDAVDFEVQ